MSAQGPQKHRVFTISQLWEDSERSIELFRRQFKEQNITFVEIEPGLLSQLNRTRRINLLAALSFAFTPSITHVSLKDNQLGATSVLYFINSLQPDVHITYLDLTNNCVDSKGREGLERLGKVCKAKNLFEVILDNNHLRWESVRSFIKAIQGSPLNTLSLNFNPITTIGFENIICILSQTQTSITTLRIYNKKMAPIDDETIVAIIKADLLNTSLCNLVISDILAYHFEEVLEQNREYIHEKQDSSRLDRLGEIKAMLHEKLVSTAKYSLENKEPTVFKEIYFSVDRAFQRLSLCEGTEEGKSDDEELKSAANKI